jgi:hypothetical protein
MRLSYLRSGGIVPATSNVLNGIGVDPVNRVIKGAVIAESGMFKTPGRGQFDKASLQSIVRLMKAEPKGIRSRFTHPDRIDALGTFLGRMRNPRIDGNYLRADLHLDDSAFVSPLGDLGTYILTLGRSDPSSFGSSLVLEADRETVPPARGSSYYPPPIWRPSRVYCSDLVFEGEAVHSGLLPSQFSQQTEDEEILRELNRVIAAEDEAMVRDLDMTMRDIEGQDEEARMRLRNLKRKMATDTDEATLLSLEISIREAELCL